MSVIVNWEAPSTLSSGVTYTINMYRSIDGEDGDYSLLSALSGTSSLTTYTDTGGQTGYYYYVKYVIDGNEGSLVLAWIEETVRETRLLTEIRRGLPSDINVFSGQTNRDLKIDLQNALHAVNMVSPLTSYSITNMPAYYEPVIKLGAMIFVFFNTYLQIAIKDFTYGEGGISLNVDRGSRVNTAIQNVTKEYNGMLKWVKMNDYPLGIAVGSYAIAIPQGRVLSFLYQAREHI